ncbi:hypothetical protein M3J09_008683 [Ascochyta lentis]
MSTPPTAGPHDGERRKSLGKYVKRMSSVFKREKSSKSVAQTSSVAPDVERQTSSEQQTDVPRADVARKDVVREDAVRELDVGDEVATQAAGPDMAKAESMEQHHPTGDLAAAPAAAANDLTTTTANDLTTTSIQTPAPAPAPAPVQFTSPLDRNAMQQERARALFAKYGLTLESSEWMAASAPAPAPLVPRVEKAIRMRVHRSCHRCGTLYGHDKVCLQCEHKRCKKCPRYPKKKTPGDKSRDKTRVQDAGEQPMKKKLLTLTTRSGNERAYQPATQRVRRTCHKCDALFVPPTATTCASCKHARCTKCPREPAKLSKWPAGYPGDAEAETDDDLDLDVEKQLEQFRRIWRKPRRIVRWECEQCHNLFRQGSPLCPGCGHERCDQCTRSPVKKPRQEETFDPAVVAAVEAKLRAMGVDDDPPTSEPEHA